MVSFLVREPNIVHIIHTLGLISNLSRIAVYFDLGRGSSNHLGKYVNLKRYNNYSEEAYNLNDSSNPSVYVRRYHCFNIWVTIVKIIANKLFKCYYRQRSRKIPSSLLNCQGWSIYRLYVWQI